MMPAACVLNARVESGGAHEAVRGAGLAARLGARVSGHAPQTAQRSIVTVDALAGCTDRELAGHFGELGELGHGPVCACKVLACLLRAALFDHRQLNMAA